MQLLSKVEAESARYPLSTVKEHSHGPHVVVLGGPGATSILGNRNRCFFKD